MRRKWKVGLLFGMGVLSLALLASILVHIVMTPKVLPPGVTKMNFEHVRFGMSLEEVKRVLGSPFPVVLPNTPTELEGEICRSTCWIGEDGQIVVYYTDRHGVFEKAWSGQNGTRETKNEWQQ
jgi:hypothetical protein